MKAFFGNQPVNAATDPRPWSERILDALFSKKAIVNCDRDIYLHRWFIIRTKYFGLFIHKFVRSDEDRALHDHPWPFIVIPVWRGYIEHSMGWDDGDGTRHGPPIAYDIKRRVYPILGARYRPATYRHRVELLPCDDQGGAQYEADCPTCQGIGAKPSWSIFIRFRKVRDWGFWLPGGWQQWAAFLRDKCE